MREEKKFFLEEIKEQMASRPAFLLTSYAQMDPNLTFDFRTAISNTGGLFCVVKKRVFLKAAAEAGVSFDREALKGHIGVIYSGSDAVETTKAVYTFKKTNENKIEVLGGHFEGKLCSPQDMEEIAKLPSQEQMRAQFLSVLEAPLSQNLATMEAILTSVIFCLDNKEEASA